MIYALCFYQKLAVLHDLLVIDPNVEFSADHIDVRSGIPIGASVRPVGISKRDVNARIFLILENFANQIFQPNIGADREFTDTVAVGVRVSVLPEIVLEFPIGRVRLGEAIALHADRERSFFQVSELCAEIIANHAVDDKSAIYLARRGEDFSTGQVAPLFWRNNTAGFQPLVIRIEVGGEICTGRGFCADLGSFADHLDDFLAQSVDSLEVGSHAFEHDLPVDIDHVRVADLAAIDHVGHLDARAEFIRLHLDGKDGDLAGFQVVENLAWQVFQRAVCQFLQNPGVVRCAHLLEFSNDGGGNLKGDFVRNDTHALAWLNAQADVHGVVSPGGEFGIEGNLV